MKSYLDELEIIYTITKIISEINYCRFFEIITEDTLLLRHTIRVSTVHFLGCKKLLLFYIYQIVVILYYVLY